MEPLMRHPTVAVGDLSGIRSSAFPGTCGPGFRGINGNLPRAGPTIYSTTRHSVPRSGFLILYREDPFMSRSKGVGQ
jgi:hypothetical protein